MGAIKEREMGNTRVVKTEKKAKRLHACNILSKQKA
jgi:hypothetical protein